MSYARESQLNALATELATLSTDTELDYFFGNFVKKAMGGIKSFAGSPLGQTLVGGLKAVAKQALPKVAGALGNAIVPGAGGAIGQKLGSFAASHMEAEQDAFLGNILSAVGFEGEDQFLGDVLGAVGLESETAKDLVKVAAAATKKAQQAPPYADVRVVVRDAIMDAIKEFAPRLMHSGNTCNAGHGGEGRWFRRGNKIILVGA